MNQIRKKLYKQRHKQEMANVKQLLLSDDSSNNMIGLMLAVTQLKWGSERIAKAIMKPCYLYGYLHIDFNNVIIVRKTLGNIQYTRFNIYHLNTIFTGAINYNYHGFNFDYDCVNYYDYKITLMDYIEGLIKRNKL